MGILSFLDTRTKPVLGLDISSTSVKLLELSRQGDRYRVENYAVRPLPPNAVVEKNIHDPEAVAQVIKAMVKQSKTKLKNTDRKSTRLNSSHVAISYAVFCLKKKN